MKSTGSDQTNNQLIWSLPLKKNCKCQFYTCKDQKNFFRRFQAFLDSFDIEANKQYGQVF